MKRFPPLLSLLALAACASADAPKSGSVSDTTTDTSATVDSVVPDSAGEGSGVEGGTEGGGTEGSGTEGGGTEGGGTDDSGSPPDDTGASSPDDTASTDTASTDTGGTEPEDEDPPTFLDCFGDTLDSDGGPSPDYDAYGPVMGSHCHGTNHQDITDVQRVVFVGDSITVGSPPTAPDDFYRVQLAAELADRFGLEEPEWDWDWYNAFEGTTITAHSGDFWSCAEWGARTDDLIRDNDQILDCFPVEDWDMTTLVVITMGGNDLYNLTQDYAEGATTDELWESVYEWTELMREAVEYLKDEDNWGAPVYVVNADTYEFTDGMGDLGSCPVADLAGMGDAVLDTDVQEMVVWANEEYLSAAVDNNADMVFMMEEVCGHGFNRDDDTGRCYRGTGSELWFDITCIHPNESGHDAITEMITAVVDE